MASGAGWLLTDTKLHALKPKDTASAKSDSLSAKNTEQSPAESRFFGAFLFGDRF